MALNILLGCLLRLPLEAVALIVLTVPPAILALPTLWWGLSTYVLASIALLLAWALFLAFRTGSE